MKMQGKVALITGGAGDIGFAAAQRFLSEGAKVLLVGRTAATLDAALERLQSPLAASVVADASSVEGVRTYVNAAVERYGKIDVFFNNAGIEGPRAPIAEFPEEAFDEVMRINVRGVFLGMKYVPPHMNDGGSVIISSSIAGLMGSGGFVAYTTSKHAVIGIMRDTAIDLAPRRIRVNTLHPGFVKSEMLLRILRGVRPGVSDDELLASMGEQTRLGRCVTAQETADMIAFLACDDSRMVTGQTLVVDGGTLL